MSPFVQETATDFVVVMVFVAAAEAAEAEVAAAEVAAAEVAAAEVAAAEVAVRVRGEFVEGAEIGAAVEEVP